MIAIASSTRADWGLLTPLAAELRRQGIPYTVYASNMHLLPEMGMTVTEIEASGEKPVKLHTARTSACETFAATASAYGEAMRKDRPNTIIILGDRYEMLAVASAAVMCGVPVTHIAGGTVSEGAIDNSIRNAITQLASLHLPETEACGERLKRMGIAGDDICVTGALGVYNALHQQLMTHRELEESLGEPLPKRYFTGTLHAATLDKKSPKAQMEEFLQGLDSFLASSPDFGAILTYPNNDVDPTPQIGMLKQFAERHPGKIILRPSLGMRRYLSAVAMSEGVIGNSSGGIVETASLRVPTLDIGIRQKGREHAQSVIHCDHDRESIAKGLAAIVGPDVKTIAAKGENPYEKPGTPVLMAKAITEMLAARRKRY